MKKKGQYETIPLNGETASDLRAMLYKLGCMMTSISLHGERETQVKAEYSSLQAFEANDLISSKYVSGFARAMRMMGIEAISSVREKRESDAVRQFEAVIAECVEFQNRNKILSIKEVRARTGIGLKDAKEAVEFYLDSITPAKASEKEEDEEYGGGYSGDEY